MKKLIVLVAALLLVSMGAMASDVTLSGEVETRWMQDFGAKTFTDANIVELKLDAVVDDNAALYIELEEGTPNIGSNFDKAHFTLDLGGIYDLPVGVTLRTGWDEYDQFDAVKVSPSESEDVIGSDMEAWGHEVNIAASDMIAIRVLWANDFALEYWSAGVAVTYDPIYVEVSYVNMDAVDIGDGDLEAGVEFMMEVGDGMDVAAAATIDYDLADAAAADDATFMYGFAGAFTYNDMVTIAGILKGQTDYEAAYAQVDIEAMPVEAVTLYMFIGLGLDDALFAETFDGLEFAAKVMIGPSTWIAGLMYVPDGGTGEANEYSDFATPTTDSSSIFVRAELKY